jgi:2-C-methyl-D-erythritol 2,4-cyclodiphosphate synthase
MPRARIAARTTRPPFRIGLGCDRHPFDPARPLVLGGVAIAGAPGLAGHSDADVLLHAVCDALLGALGLPDMGRRFPSSDPRFKGAPSGLFVDEALAETARAGYVIANLDAVLLAEIPRLAPHLEVIRAGLARNLRLPPERVGLKAKSGEGLGWIGREEGMAAQAVVLLEPLPPAATPVPRRRPAGRGGPGRSGRRGARRRAGR